jgi:AraC family transcriptional regulator of arabinose operon
VLEALRQLRARLLQWNEQASRESTGRDLCGQRRLAIERYIYDSHTAGASVAGLAHALRLSESRAIHLVKELFGRSYIQMVSEKRLSAAASLLRETALPIVEVCLASGFQDLSHFHRLFRRRFGVTPRKYRLLPPA